MLVGRRASFVVVVIGVVLAIVYAMNLSPASNSAASAIVGVGTVLAQVVGLRLHRPVDKLPWVLLILATVSFCGGMTVRAWAVGQTGVLQFAADIFAVSGYLLASLALITMLRRRVGVQRHAVVDGVIVALGAGLIATEFLALPAARVGNRPDLVSVLAGLYPLLDIVILLLVLNLGFSTASGLASFRFLVLAIAGLFVGDTGYAIIGARGHLTGSPLLDLPFLLGFTMLAACALHPSMAELSAIRPRPVQAWSMARLSLILPALASPVVAVLVLNGGSYDNLALALATGGLIAALVFRAVSAVRSNAEIQRGLVFRATHDPLTGLPNRDALTQNVGEMLASRRTEGVWLLYLDLDGFKLVNDHWGHEVGDLLLVEVSKRLRDLTEGTSMLARIAGDEFVVASFGQTVHADALAEKIQTAMAQPVELPGIELVAVASIGIAPLTDQRSAESLLRDADLAVNRAKAEGRGRVRVFDAAMRQSVRDRVEIELALRQAVQRGQLWVSYQPIVETRTGRPVGAEALVRWTHPVRGPISPVEFIPVAEETGLIDQIGTFVLEESLRQMALWRDEGLLPETFYMSVNASARQLRDHSLRRKIADGLRVYRLGGDRLSLEITESILIGDNRQVLEVLGSLRGLGIGLSVDDFGTGYSSLSYLSRFPVTTVKVDRAFVTGLGVDPGDEAIVRAIVAMSTALHLGVIAEGVETEQQRDALIGLDVARGQGWLWGKAVPHDEFAEKHLRTLLESPTWKPPVPQTKDSLSQA
ncbi:putative bifunctional diguanylate cyclase/phosphodiesterase [Kineosporia succinea]|uniref:Diguanylate cyclase (GGDEF)-like protein n=1 Tax=Kineosporia succinea TaxID=84632 RepID=A0ABT9P4J8_9ACTN|nr:EAL domain-containing protein [Kineosporia succinea]MDP9827620.1 diguanylate cyclase (GGDEF)-like protein [Kineosporia succinea]